MARSVRAHEFLIFFLGTVGVIVLSPKVFARNVYLNGVDISNAQSQEVLGVNVQINEKGDIFIIAPHYQVNEEDTYLPLSSAKATQNPAVPKHQKPRELYGKGDGEIPTPQEIPQADPLPATTNARVETDTDLAPASLETPGETAKTSVASPQAATISPAALPSGPNNQVPIPKDAQKTKN